MAETPRPPESSPPAGVPPQGTVSMISLGCPRTLVDSELYLGRLKAKGFRVVESPDGSDTVIINTCSFIQESIKESIDTIMQAVKLKQEGKIKAVVVAGCLVQRFKEELIKELPEVDGFVGVDGFGDIETVVQKASQGERPQSLRRRPQTVSQDIYAPRVGLTPPHYAYLKISEGCLKGCSFCVIPKIKGPLASRPFEALVDEAKQLVEERGVKELIVVGQDTSDYGVDRYGAPRIAELMRALGAVNGLRWIRLLYCHPFGISDALIAAIQDTPSVCKYLDMAIEHANDAALKRMNRLVTQAHLRERIGALRRAMPGIALRTSIIVGFPGETEGEFADLLNFLREIRFERLGAFLYSKEEGSASFRMPEQIAAAIANERFDRLMAVQQEIAASLNAAAVGSTLDVIIDEPVAGTPGQYMGRTAADCPEVDGAVFVQSRQMLVPGAFLPVRITDSLEYDLIGEAV